METVEDIVRKMRETVSIIADKESEGSDILSVWSILSTFADRIENAHNRYKDDNLIGYPHSFCTLGNEVKAMETIEEIINELRNGSIYDDCLDMHELADRIEKAHGESLRCQAELLKEYRAENARIKAALKPVLDYAEHWTMSDSERSSRRLIAIKEARSIYNEGSEK